jgi:hypothetical protein
LKIRKQQEQQREEVLYVPTYIQQTVQKFVSIALILQDL